MMQKGKAQITTLGVEMGGGGNSGIEIENWSINSKHISNRYVNIWYNLDR